MNACVILYRSPATGGVYGELDRNTRRLREFANRDDAIAFAEKQLGEDIPYQIVELDEL